MSLDDKLRIINAELHVEDYDYIVYKLLPGVEAILKNKGHISKNKPKPAKKHKIDGKDSKS